MNWFHMILASNQELYVNTALGVGDPELERFAYTPINYEEESFATAK